MPRLSASLNYNPTKPSRFEGALPHPHQFGMNIEIKGLWNLHFVNA